MLAMFVSPYLLYSGQALTDPLLTNGLQLGATLLIGLAVLRLLLASWQLSTGYFGGTIFPTILAGGALGMALHNLAPFVPLGVAVLAVMAGLVAAAAPIPLGVTVLLAVISQPSLVPVAAIGAITGALVRLAFEPEARGRQVAEDGTAEVAA